MRGTADELRFVRQREPFDRRGEVAELLRGQCYHWLQGLHTWGNLRLLFRCGGRGLGFSGKCSAVLSPRKAAGEISRRTYLFFVGFRDSQSLLVRARPSVLNSPAPWRNSPPSMRMTSPLMYEEPSLTKNAARFANSSVVPKR